jgi:hypothetical protein
LKKYVHEMFIFITLFDWPNVIVDIVLTRVKHLHGRTITLRRDVWAHKANPTTCYWSPCTKRGKGVVMYFVYRFCLFLLFCYCMIFLFFFILWNTLTRDHYLFLLFTIYVYVITFDYMFFIGDNTLCTSPSKSNVKDK